MKMHFSNTKNIPKIKPTAVKPATYFPCQGILPFPLLIEKYLNHSIINWPEMEIKGLNSNPKQTLDPANFS